MLTYFKTCLNEASEKQRTIIKVCSGNMGSFLVKYTFFGLIKGYFAAVTSRFNNGVI